MTTPDDELNLSGGNQPPKQPAEQPISSRGEETNQNQAPSTNEKSLFSTLQETRSEDEFHLLEGGDAAFRREMNVIPFPDQKSETHPRTPPPNPARRRRRSGRLVERVSASELGARIDLVAQRTTPNLDFFVLSFLSGCILAIGYMLDFQAILLLGIFAAPQMAPWVGLTLSTVTGEFRLFRQTLGGLITSVLMVFTIGVLAGYASKILQPITTTQSLYHARLWWPDLLLLVIGSITLVMTYIQSGDKPVIASLMVAYEFLLPVSAAGFGLGSGVPGLWPEAGLVFVIHLAISLVISLILFFYMGFHPERIGGYFLLSALCLGGVAILAGWAGFGNLINIRGDQISAIVTITPTAAPAKPTAIRPNPTFTQVPVSSATPSVTPLPRLEPSPSAQPSPTETTPTASPAVFLEPTLLPTPVYGRVQSESGGVMVRKEPGGTSITTVQNGYLVEIIGDAPVVVEGTVWVHVIVRTPNHDIEGWVLLDLIVTATPSSP